MSSSMEWWALPVALGIKCLKYEYIEIAWMKAIAERREKY